MVDPRDALPWGPNSLILMQKFFKNNRLAYPLFGVDTPPPQENPGSSIEFPHEKSSVSLSDTICAIDEIEELGRELCSYTLVTVITVMPAPDTMMEPNIREQPLL